MSPPLSPGPAPIPIADRDGLVAQLARHRAVHVYGLCDTEEPFWSRSQWWQRGRATLGDIGLSDDPRDRTVYAINVEDPDGALDLWADVDHLLADRFFATGPVDMVSRVRRMGRVVEWDAGIHLKMVLTPETTLSAWASSTTTTAEGLTVRPLSAADLGAIDALHAQRIDPAAYFHPSLLTLGPFTGIFDHDRLVAMAGIHVCSPALRLAAIGGVLVDPHYRGRGLGRLVTGVQCRALRDLGITTIGLNVTESNAPARRIYDELGFTIVHRYAEAQFATPE